MRRSNKKLRRSNETPEMSKKNSMRMSNQTPEMRMVVVVGARMNFVSKNRTPKVFLLVDFYEKSHFGMTGSY